MEQLKNQINQAYQALPHAVIVEDEESLSVAFGIALRQAGFFVETFTDGRAALDYLKTISPHLVILDLNLPNVSGDEILEEIKALTTYNNTHIFLATANARLGRHFADKVDLVLEKPISIWCLKNLMQRYNPVMQPQKPLVSSCSASDSDLQPFSSSMLVTG